MSLKAIATRMWQISDNKPELLTGQLVASTKATDVCLRCVYLLITSDSRQKLISPGVAEVISSNAPSIQPGAWVVANLPWADYASLPADKLQLLACGFAGIDAGLVVDEAFNKQIRKRYKPIVMGLQNALKIVAEQPRLLQVSIARQTVSVSNNDYGEDYVVQASASVSFN